MNTPGSLRLRWPLIVAGQGAWLLIPNGVRVTEDALKRPNFRVSLQRTGRDYNRFAAFPQPGPIGTALIPRAVQAGLYPKYERCGRTESNLGVLN